MNMMNFFKKSLFIAALLPFLSLTSTYALQSSVLARGFDEGGGDRYGGDRYNEERYYDQRRGEDYAHPNAYQYERRGQFGRDEGLYNRGYNQGNENSGQGSQVYIVPEQVQGQGGGGYNGGGQ